MSAHTPGPWGASQGIVAAGSLNGPPWESLYVAEVFDQEDGSYEANARLIAAAPELLEALKALLANADSTLPADWRMDRPVSAAKAAIAKAEGR